MLTNPWAEHSVITDEKDVLHCMQIHTMPVCMSFSCNFHDPGGLPQSLFAPSIACGMARGVVHEAKVNGFDDRINSSALSH